MRATRALFPGSVVGIFQDRWLICNAPLADQTLDERWQQGEHKIINT